uniref:Ras family GTPase n=1 Tax=Pithovirus LCPAC302 TaxID=2506593 RepID=A0A481Z6E3_9VIRU|nr:MAG: Ras family GTPase [Pithovirus LCPAC302]
MELKDYKNNDEFSNPYVVRCIMLGDFGVGKSTITKILSEGMFDRSLEATVGIDFASKFITLPDFNNHQVKLQVWDTSGSERFFSIITNYLRDVYIAFIVFDMTDRKSFKSIDKWKIELEKYKKYNSIPLIVLVGTKCDLRNHQITSKEIRLKAKEWGCNFYVISATQSNSYNMVYRMFTISAEDLHSSIVQDYIYGKDIPKGVLKSDPNRYFDSYDFSEENKKWCCFA